MYQLLVIAMVGTEDSTQYSVSQVHSHTHTHTHTQLLTAGLMVMRSGRTTYSTEHL